MEVEMPISKRGDKWYWGSQGPFDSRKKAEEVAGAAHASGYQKLLKEDGGGDGGDGVGGVNGTVFTSSHTGIFTPTHGERDKKRKKRKDTKKNKHKQQHAQERVFGNKKKSGVEKLEDFITDRSPLKKAVNKRVDGMGQEVAHNPQNNPMRVDYKKLGEDREIGTDNQPNSSMSGLDSRMDASTHVPKHQGVEAPNLGAKEVPRKQEWGTNKAYVQKAGMASFANIGPQPDQNIKPGSISDEPQKPFIERKKDPNKIETQDVKMNDVTNRVKKYADEEDADIEQPLGVASAATSQARPVQSMEKQWGSGSERGEYRRSDDGDEIPPDEDEVLEESESDRVVNALKRLQARKQQYVEKGESHPLFLAMMDDLDAV